MGRRINMGRKNADGSMGHLHTTGKNADGSRELSITSRTAGVVLRATVETFGPAGDAELHLTVKWPAAALAAAQQGASDGEKDDEEDAGYDEEGTIRTPASTPPARDQQ
jgi:hypothetical protein